MKGRWPIWLTGTAMFALFLLIAGLLALRMR